MASTNLDLNPQNGVAGTSYIYNQGMSPNTRAANSQKVRILTPVYGAVGALHQMGALSSFGLSGMSRNMEEVRGIGFGDILAEIVPGNTAMVSISFERALLNMCNLWQSTGYASGTSGPVRSLAHHKWPFDIEQQMVFSSLVDNDFQAANIGYNNGQGGTPGSFDGGLKAVQYPQTTPDATGRPGDLRGHTAEITVYEACWFNDFGKTFSKDQALISETGNANVTAIHDFASTYGEFMATGNDPTRGQMGSMRFAQSGFPVASSQVSLNG